MKQTRLLMGMPITVEVVSPIVTERALDRVYNYLTGVDETFSTYKTTSQISRINAGTLLLEDASVEVQDIFALADITSRQTHGYFNIERDGIIDPSGIVKGWAIYRAAILLWEQG